MEADKEDYNSGREVGQKKKVKICHQNLLSLNQLDLPFMS